MIATHMQLEFFFCWEIAKPPASYEEETIKK